MGQAGGGPCRMVRLAGFFRPVGEKGAQQPPPDGDADGNTCQKDPAPKRNACGHCTFNPYVLANRRVSEKDVIAPLRG